MTNPDKNNDPLEPYAISIMKLLTVLAAVFAGAISLTAISYIGGVDWLDWAATLSLISFSSILILAGSLFCLALYSSRQK